MKSVVISIGLIMSFIATAPAKAAGRDDVIIGTVIGGIIGYAVGRDDSERNNPPPPPPVVVYQPPQPSLVKVCKTDYMRDERNRLVPYTMCYYDYR